MAKERANRNKQALKPGWGSRDQGSPAPPDGYGQGQYGHGRKLAGPQLTPSAFWNEDPRNRWLSSANLGTAIIDGVETTCLIDNGARVNLVTPEFVRERGLDVGSIQDLSGHNGHIPLSRLGGKITEPLGYVMFQHTYEFANYMIQLNPEDYGMPMPTNTGKNPTDLDGLVLLKNKATILAFESIILHCCTRRTMMMGYKPRLRTQKTGRTCQMGFT